MNPKVLSKKIEANEPDFSSLSTRIKVNYKDDKMSQSFTASVKILKDSLIWMSFTGF